MSKNKNPYKLPEGYFDKLQSEVKAQANIPQSTGFEVPADYFDNMQSQVIQKVKPQKAKVLNLRTRSWSGIAASMVAVLCVGLWMWSADANVSEDTTLADVSDATAIEYLLDEGLSLDQYAMMLEETEIESIDIEGEEYDLDLLDESELLELEDLL